jgi:NAD(P)-dependent dehydrogenase (short-subunit alcohol dehydrogenase family)
MNDEHGDVIGSRRPGRGSWPGSAIAVMSRKGAIAAWGGLFARQLAKAVYDEVAAAVVFVASPDAAFITGATLDVDGGFNA